jgi:hypothetical protein
MPTAKTNAVVKTAKAATVTARTARPAARQSATRAAKPAPAKALARKSAALKSAVAKPVATAVADVKPPKIKLVRDSFTIPRNEYDTLDTLKARLVQLARPAKKSEVLRAGIALLATLNDAALIAALDAVPAIKTGRPKKAKSA